jgi:hypothetical protein
MRWAEPGTRLDQVSLGNEDSTAEEEDSLDHFERDTQERTNLEEGRSLQARWTEPRSGGWSLG